MPQPATLHYQLCHYHTSPPHCPSRKVPPGRSQDARAPRRQERKGGRGSDAVPGDLCVFARGINPFAQTAYSAALQRSASELALFRALLRTVELPTLIPLSPGYPGPPKIGFVLHHRPLGVGRATCVAGRAKLALFRRAGQPARGPAALDWDHPRGRGCYLRLRTSNLTLSPIGFVPHACPLLQSALRAPQSSHPGSRSRAAIPSPLAFVAFSQWHDRGMGLL